MIMLRLFALACVLALCTTVQADQASAQSLQDISSQDSPQAVSWNPDDIKLNDDMNLGLQKAIKEEEREAVMQQAALKPIDGHAADTNHIFNDRETEHPQSLFVADASEDSRFEAQQFGWGGPGFGWGGGWGRGGWGRGGWGRGGGWGRRW